MNVDALSGPTGALLKTALDVAQVRHQVHALNVANAGVAGYVPMRANFGDELARLRSAAAAGHLAASDAPEAVFETAQDATGRLAERVEVDVEAAEIAHNTLHYQALLRGLSRHLSLIGLAIGDARK